jgi:hypothetical protein
MGHEDAFPRPRLSAHCRFSQGTFAGTGGNGRDAPIPAIRGTKIQPTGPADCGHSPPMLIFPIDNLWWPVSITV